MPEYSFTKYVKYLGHFNDYILNNYPSTFEGLFYEDTALILSFSSTIVLIDLETILDNYSEPLTVDNIAEMSTLEPHIVNQTLTFLFLSGLVEESGGRFHVRH